METKQQPRSLAERFSIGTLNTGQTAHQLTTNDLRPGDILVGRRVSSFHTLNRLSGDPWGHVGIVVEVDGQLQSSEAAPTLGRFLRPPAEFVASYRHAGVIRPRFCAPCSERVAETAVDHLNAGLKYEPRAIFAAGAVAMLARWAPQRWLPAAGAIAARLARPWASDGRTMCVGLILEAFASSCAECTPKVRPILGRAGRRRVGPEEHDPLEDSLVFSTPSAIWRAVPATQRHLVTLAPEHAVPEHVPVAPAAPAPLRAPVPVPVAAAA